MHDLRGMADAICRLTKELQAQLPATGRGELLGVGIELGGHVYRGTVIDSTHAHWTRPVNLAAELTERLNVPTVVENDVNALAIHGYYSRIFDEYSRSFDKLNLALVAVFRQGVGGALILNGRIYRGSGGLAPEPGHLTVEYRDSCEAAQHPRGNGLATFDDECACSTATHKVYGHVDTLATPSRIEGELASRRPGQEKASLADIAKAPKGVFNQDNLQVFTEEATIMQRAGRALGRALADMINIVNPGQLVLRLPEALAVPAPQSSGAEYLEAVESAVDTAYSTGPDDARGSRRARRLPIQATTTIRSPLKVPSPRPRQP